MRHDRATASLDKEFPSSICRGERLARRTACRPANWRPGRRDVDADGFERSRLFEARPMDPRRIDDAARDPRLMRVAPSIATAPAPAPSVGARPKRARPMRGRLALSILGLGVALLAAPIAVAAAGMGRAAGQCAAGANGGRGQGTRQRREQRHGHGQWRRADLLQWPFPASGPCGLRSQDRACFRARARDADRNGWIGDPCRDV